MTGYSYRINKYLPLPHITHKILFKKNYRPKCECYNWKASQRKKKDYQLEVGNVSSTKCRKQ